MATEIDTYFIPSADWANVIHSASVSGTAADGPSVAGTYRALVAIDVGDITIAAPDAFTIGQWSVDGGENEGELTFSVSALPNRNGKPITKFQYALDGDQPTPTWTDLPAGTSTGAYTVTGLVGGTTYTGTLAIRAVNAIGGGAVSDLKTATVEAGGGANLVDNGGFDSATNWSLVNAGIAITGGKLVFTATTNGRATQTLLSGNQSAGTYDYSFTVADNTSGICNVRLLLNNVTVADIDPAISGNGIYTGQVSVPSTFNQVQVRRYSGTLTCSFDDLSLSLA